MVSHSKGGISLNKRDENTAKAFRGFFGDNKRKSEKCSNTFSKPLYGFDDNADSENYFKKFERFRKSYYNPVVILERLPENVFHNGKIRKRFLVNVKSQRTASMKGPSMPDYAVKMPVSVQVQRCMKNNHGAREGKRGRIQNGVSCEYENKVDTKPSPTRPYKSGMVKSPFIILNNSQNCDEYSADECNCSLTDDSGSVQNGPDELVVRGKKSVDAQPPLECKILFIPALHEPLVAEKQERVEAQCSEKYDTQLDNKRAMASPHCENQFSLLGLKSIHQKEAKDNLPVGGFGINVCFSTECHWNRTWTRLLTKSTSKSMFPEKPIDNGIDESGNGECISQDCSWKRLYEMLKPFVVQMNRIPDLDRTVKRKVKQGDSVHSVEINAGSRRIADERIFQGSFRSNRNARAMSEIPEKKKRSPARHVEVLNKVDLSDGLVLKKFCELQSISLVDSDSDDEANDRVVKDRGQSEIKEVIIISDSEDENSVGVMDGRAPTPVSSCVLEDRASSSAVSSLFEDRVSSTVLSHVIENPDSLSIDVLENHASSSIHPHPDVHLLHSCLMVGGPDTSADSVVPDNPDPRGVQALNELGFLDRESFQYGKQQPSESVWSDVLDFDEADESEMECISPLQDRILLPLTSDDFIPSLDSEKQIEAGSILGNVTISLDLQKSGLETVNNKLKMQKDTADIFLSDKEDLVNDSFISDEPLEEPNFEIPKSTPSNDMGESEFSTSAVHSKKRPSDVSQQLGDKEEIEKGNETKVERGFHDMSNDTAEVESSQGISRPIVGNKKFRMKGSGTTYGRKKLHSVTGKHRSRDHGSKNDPDIVLKAERDSQGFKYRKSLRWMTQVVRVDKGKNDGSFDNKAKSKKIETDAKEDIPTSEKLHRDLSAIPYILKCNLQNRCRKCKNLNPCANANKNFNLFWTLTVGIGQRLSKPLMETLQNPEDPGVINRTTAYIAASAVKSRHATILVPALPETVQKVLPIHHSKLLMELVDQTIEMEKQKKRSNSDMAIAETLQFKRAQIAMKARFPIVENQDLPISKQTVPSILTAPSVLSKRPSSYKSSQIVSVKSKADHKFKFVKKSLVSILPKHQYKVVNKTDEVVNDEKSGDPTQNECGGVHVDARLELRNPPRKRSKLSPECDKNSNGPFALAATIPVNSVSGATSDTSNDVISAHTDLNCGILTGSSNHQNNIIYPLKKSRASSISSDQNHNETMEPDLKKLVLDSSRGDNFNSNVSCEPVCQIIAELCLNETANGSTSSGTDGLSFKCGVARSGMGHVILQKSGETQKFNAHDVILKKSDCFQLVDPPTGGTDDCHANRSCSAFSTRGISSVGCGESGYGSPNNETNFDPPETEHMTPSNHLPEAHGYETGKERQLVPTRAMCSQVNPDVAPSKSRLPHMHSFTSIQENEVHRESNESVQTSADPEHSSDLPDVILVPEEVESIDLTAGEEMNHEPILEWGVVCSSLPELGFVRVEKIYGKLVLNDKSVSPDPLQFNSVWELSTFLNTRIAELTYSRKSKKALQWNLVTSGYLVVENVPPTNPSFWLSRPSTKQTLEEVRDTVKHCSTPSSVIPAKGGQSNPTPTVECSVESAGKASKRIFVGNYGKIIRINGQTVVLGSPANNGETVVLGSPANVTKKNNKSLHKSILTTLQASEVKTAVPLSSTAPQYIVHPGSITPSGHPTKYVLTSKQPGMANPTVSSAPKAICAPPSVPATRMRTATTKHVPLVPETSKGPVPILPAPGTQRVGTAEGRRTQKILLPRNLQANNIRVPYSATRGLIQILPAPRMKLSNTISVPLVPAASLTTPAPSGTHQGTQIRGPLKQVVATPDSVTCVTLANNTQFVSEETGKSVSTTVQSCPTPSSHGSSCVPSSFTPLSTAQKPKQVPIAPRENPPRSHRPILIIRSSSQGGAPKPQKFVFQKS